MNKKDIYRSIIISETEDKTIYAKEDAKNYLKFEAHSITGCSDSFNIFIKEENDIIKDAKWNGKGCSLSTASLNILLKEARGKTKKEILKIMDEMISLVNTGESNIDLGDFIVFENIKNFKNRVGCTLLGINTLYKYSEVKNG